MHSLLNSGESYVLLNDIPDKPFLCKRGVRQGDPLSPLLFVLTADLLQSIVNNAWSRGILKHPIDEPFGGDYPIVQYADDTLLILQTDGRILFNLKCLLRSFSDSTGLNVNFQKSFLVPINVSQSRTSHLSRTFGCAIGTMPFTYLGLPLGTTKSTLQDFFPMMTRIENRLSIVSKFLSYHGRLILVNSVMIALPTFYMCTLQLPPQISKQIDSYRKNAFGVVVKYTEKGAA